MKINHKDFFKNFPKLGAFHKRRKKGILNWIKNLFIYSEDKNLYVIRSAIAPYLIGDDEFIDRIKTLHVRELQRSWCHKFEHRRISMNERDNFYTLTTTGVR